MIKKKTNPSEKGDSWSHSQRGQVDLIVLRALPKPKPGQYPAKARTFLVRGVFFFFPNLSILAGLGR